MCASIDDLLITGENEEEHLKNLEAVLARFQVAGVRLRFNKCAFMLSEDEYQGICVSDQGLHPTPKKVKVLNYTPTLTNVPRFKSFLGLLNYYNKFLPRTTLAPLYKLLQSKVPWTWSTAQQKAFEVAKAALTSDHLLITSL